MAYQLNIGGQSIFNIVAGLARAAVKAVRAADVAVWARAQGGLEHSGHRSHPSQPGQTSHPRHPTPVKVTTLAYHPGHSSHLPEPPQ